MHGAAEIAMLRKIAGGAEQHRGVPVMAAGMHLAGILRGMGEAVLLMDVQGVHIGAKPDGALSRPLADDRTDNARAADALADLDAPFAQLRGDDRGGAHLLEAGLRMRMDVAADLRELRPIGLHLGDQVLVGHGVCPLRRAKGEWRMANGL